MKRKQWIALAMVGALLGIALSGCANGNGAYTGNHSVNYDKYEITSGPTRTSYVTNQMMAEADAWPECDDTAVAAVMKKAEAGEHVVIAVLGGSITQGTVSSGTKDSEVKNRSCYAQHFFDWWTLIYPNADLEFVNAGIGGTDSYLGVHRAAADVLSKKPDLVLIEYAVNDGSTAELKESYENLVRNMLQSETHPAVMLLFMAQTNGSTAQVQQSYVGQNYKVPMLSYANLIDGCMKRGEYTKEELSGDTVHPSALGHAITGEMLWHYLNEVLTNLDKYAEYTPSVAAPITSDKYANATILDSTNVEPLESKNFEKKNSSYYFPNGWLASQADSSIVFEVDAKNIGLLFLKTVDGNSGTVQVLVDGQKAGTVNADFAGGWGDAIDGKEVYSSEESQKHRVEIRFDENSKGNVFKLLGLLIS